MNGAEQCRREQAEAADGVLAILEGNRGDVSGPEFELLRAVALYARKLWASPCKALADADAPPADVRLVLDAYLPPK